MPNIYLLQHIIPCFLTIAVCGKKRTKRTYFWEKVDSLPHHIIKKHTEKKTKCSHFLTTLLLNSVKKAVIVIHSNNLLNQFDQLKSSDRKKRREFKKNYFNLLFEFFV